jgi:hypothetical protein
LYITKGGKKNMCAACTCLWLDDIVFYTFNLTGWIDGHMKSASPSQLQASKPTTTTQNHGTNNIHSHTDGYTSKSTSQVLLPHNRTIYHNV